MAAGVVLIGVILWAIFGSPAQTAADIIWGDEPAPWEEVDAYYYPDRSNLNRYEQQNDVGSLDHCRAWVQRQASLRDDLRVRKGDYECAVGKHDYLGLSVYRTKAR